MLYFRAVQYCTGLQSLTWGIKSPGRGWFFGYAKGRLLGEVFPDQRCGAKFTDEFGRGQQNWRGLESVLSPETLKNGGGEGKASRAYLPFVHTAAIAWVFASPDLNGKKPRSYICFYEKLGRACQNAGIEHVSAHSFRDSYRAWLDELGTPSAFSSGRCVTGTSG